MAESCLFEGSEGDDLAACLRGMRLSALEFNQIHRPDVLTNQVANCHETYLPITLRGSGCPNVNVNNFFNSDFAPTYGDYDEETGLHTPRAYVIIGAKGAGKTALLNYLKYQWILKEATDVPRIKSFDYAALINGHEIKAFTSLHLLVKSIFAPYFPESIDDEATFAKLMECKILWLVDDYHKAKDKIKQVIWEIFMRFPVSKVIITTHISDAVTIRTVLANCSIKHLMLRLKYVNHIWMDMVPKMVKAKTSDQAKIEDITTKFIADLETLIRNTPKLSPRDLGQSLDKWIEFMYPFVLQGVPRARFLAKLAAILMGRDVEEEAGPSDE